MAVTLFECGTDPGAFVPVEACAYEGSRIVALAIFDKDFDVQPLDATLASWEESEGVLLSGIEIIKPVAGNFVRPTENTVPGKGFIDTETASRSFDIPISHYGVDGNLLYWNAKTHSNAYSCGFVFEDMKMFVALARDGKLVPMNFFDGAESEDALGNKRQNIVNIRWRHPDNPYSIAVPSELFK